MRKQLTQIQCFALEMLFRRLGETSTHTIVRRHGAKDRAYSESLKQAHHLINDELRSYSQTAEFKEREFCRFKAGDEIIRYEKYPASISRETIRQALLNSGWWPPRGTGSGLSY